jgi:hypothetical protein
MLRAVAGWSPVIISVRMPARRAARIAARTSVRGGSIRPTRPRKTMSRSAISVSPVSR